jgi:ribosomal protein S18 acetylase RimI-like enzyme
MPNTTRCERHGVGSMKVGPCTRESMRRLEALATDHADLVHHRERWAWHGQGTAIYLLAWQDDRLVGRATLLKASKYEEVRAAFPGAWEMIALEARPQGRGVGTRLIAEAERQAAASQAPVLGLAVGPDNAGARRLYRRLGYVETQLREVIDEWEERDKVGRVVRAHADACLYLMKPLL